jgi:hypothetical protein
MYDGTQFPAQVYSHPPLPVQFWMRSACAVADFATLAILFPEHPSLAPAANNLPPEPEQTISEPTERGGCSLAPRGMDYSRAAHVRAVRQLAPTVRASKLLFQLLQLCAVVPLPAVLRQTMNRLFFYPQWWVNPRKSTMPGSIGQIAP